MQITNIIRQWCSEEHLTNGAVAGVAGAIGGADARGAVCASRGVERTDRGAGAAACSAATIHFETRPVLLAAAKIVLGVGDGERR